MWLLLLACDPKPLPGVPLDEDLDGFYSGASGGNDCNDGDAAVFPGAEEVCDGIDNDCDSKIDDIDPNVQGAQEVYADDDRDGWGGDAVGRSCEPKDGEATTPGDCDDGDYAINPDATEICDERDEDEDCDGVADDLDSSVDPATFGAFHVDADGDGYGADEILACDLSEGVVQAGADCDDADPAVNPDAAEACDDADRDEDCDGLADDADPDVTGATDTWVDGDGDGVGAGEPYPTCDPGEGEASAGGDCDDADPKVGAC